MILVSRPPNVSTPSPIQILAEDFVAFVQRPYMDDATAGGDLPITTPTPNNPETRDHLLSYAYVVYDASITQQLPPQSIPPGHAALLLPLLELLHGQHPYNSPVALLLGCVYHYHDLVQRSLQINRHILRYDPDNVRTQISPSAIDLRRMAQVSAMCNLGANLRSVGLPLQAFECWRGALRISPVNWDILVGYIHHSKSFFEFTEEGQHAGDFPWHR